MRVRRSVRLLAVLILIGVATGGVYRFERSRFMRTDSERTRRAVLARIPIGTEIATARQIMEADGFTCEKMRSRYADDDPAGGRSITFPAADILWCDSKERWALASVISKRWQIIFVQRVARITVGGGLTGP